MSTTVKSILNIIEKIAPAELAMEWDNVGLLVGDSNAKVSSILLALDVTNTVLEESKNYDLLLTHHPLIFKAIKNVTAQSLVGNKIIELIKNNTALIAAHTNLDAAENGINYLLCQKFGILNANFFGNNLGKVGELEKEISLKQLAELVKTKLGLEYIRAYGDLNKPIKRVAVCGGSGMSFSKFAIEEKADVYLTGDITYHDACDAVEMGVCLIDITHFASEIIFCSELAVTLNNELFQIGESAKIDCTIKQKQPIQIL